MLRAQTPSDDTPALSRALRLQGLLAVALALLTGAVITIQGGFGLSKFGGQEYLPRVILLSATRQLGPAVSAAGAFWALLVWTHRLDVNAIRPNLKRAAPWAATVACVVSPLTTCLTVLGGFLACRWLYGLPWQTILTSRSQLAWDDLAAATRSLAWSISSNAALAWLCFPAMQRRSWPLTLKIGVLLLISLLISAAMALAKSP